jgi:hypothetical protein
MSEKCDPTLPVARGATRVHKDLVGSLDGEHTSEVRVDMREKGHDCGPYQRTVIVLLGLYKIVQSCNGGESYEITRVELKV